MNIQKLEPELVQLIHASLQNYIRAWHKIPSNLDIENIRFQSIRYAMDWGLKTAPEDGFIIEFEHRKEMLGRSELGLSVEEFKTSIAEQNQNGLLFGKDLLIHQAWDEYPVVYGKLDELDNKSDYEVGGKYASNDYSTFKTKYD